MSGDHSKESLTKVWNLWSHVYKNWRDQKKKKQRERVWSYVDMFVFLSVIQEFYFCPRKETNAAAEKPSEGRGQIHTSALAARWRHCGETQDRNPPLPTLEPI